ncbi:MAG TPA: DNA alkylation repair protein [Anaerolineales bacterium]|nr:DNA alkylation repair protein [Anaerolineales bacterium]
MPAIDPDRLTRQVAKVAAAIGDPTELRRRTLDVLEFYADRTRRPGASTQVDDVPPAFGVARPVMRALTVSLLRAVAARPENTQPAAEALWRAESRETRLLAAALIGDLKGEDAPTWIERYFTATDDNFVMLEMAGRGLASWRKSDPSGVVDNLARWLDSSQRPLQHLALLAMAAAVDDPEFRQLPQLFTLLSGRSGSFRGETRNAFTRAVKALARRSPPETTHFLLAELATGDPGAVRLARIVIDSLPADNAARLRQALPRPRGR